MSKKLAVVILAVAVAAGLAPAAQAAGHAKLPGINVHADPNVPPDKTPIPIFEVTHTHKRWQYWLSGTLEVRRSQYCIDSIGSLMPRRATSSTVVFDRRPAFWKEQPYMIEQTYNGYAPCKGIYRGYLKVKAPRARPTRLRTFKLDVPSMKLTYVRR